MYSDIVFEFIILFSLSPSYELSGCKHDTRSQTCRYIIGRLRDDSHPWNSYRVLQLSVLWSKHYNQGLFVEIIYFEVFNGVRQCFVVLQCTLSGQK